MAGSLNVLKCPHCDVEFWRIIMGVEIPSGTFETESVNEICSSCGGEYCLTYTIKEQNHARQQKKD